jgi:uncharacterized Zn-finger protein
MTEDDHLGWNASGSTQQSLWVYHYTKLSVLFLTRCFCVLTGFLIYPPVDTPFSKGNQLGGEKFSSEWNPDISRFVCKECGMSYRQHKNLVAHKKIHLGETCCHLCNKVLSRKSHVIRHLLHIHGIRVPSQAHQ